jgi:hypothetical protein
VARQAKDVFYSTFMKRNLTLNAGKVESNEGREEIKQIWNPWNFQKC